MPAMGNSSFSTFGDLLKYLRRRAQLTQRELAIAVGYTEGHISRLEKNQRPPDLATVAALFVPALMLEEEPETAAYLIQLAAGGRGQKMSAGESLTISRRQETREISELEENIPSNLPIQLTTFIGRQAAIAEITALLAGATPARLLTLTGPGGIGKTRLALQTAIGLSHVYPDGIWFVDLAPLSSPELVPPTVASTLSIAEAGTQSIEETLIAYLRQKQILIVIDNCEHLIRATAQLAEKLLRSCARVQLLATSRELLKVPGEVNFRVPPLSLPEDQDGAGQTAMGHEAVQLFVERARNIQHDFALANSNTGMIARICRQLDGMPLAIELAAARTSLLSLGQIEARLQDRFQLLSGGHPTLPRHQTLRATIEWSHDLLSETEKMLFRRLSVFAGGWTLESANFTCAQDTNDVLDLLAQLVNKSLVVVERQPNTEVRYRMLETIREYASEQLKDAGEREGLRARHFDYFFTMAEQAEPQLFHAESSVDWAETEISNLRAALAWALEKDGDGNASGQRVARALELMIHVWPLWLSRGYSIEGHDWLNQLLSMHTAATPGGVRALLLASDLAGFRGDSEKKASLIREALDLAHQTGDRRVIGMSLMEMGLVEREHHYPEAVRWLSQSLAAFRELEDSLWECRTSFLLAETYTMYGNLEAAKPLLRRALELCRAENDKWQIAWGLEVLGNVYRLEGNLEKARQLYAESLPLKASVMDKLGIAYSLAAFAQLAAAQKNFERAAILWAAAEHLGETLNLLLIPSRAPLYTSLISLTRAHLGEDALHAAWQQGRKMKMQDAINFALASPHS